MYPAFLVQTFSKLILKGNISVVCSCPMSYVSDSKWYFSELEDNVASILFG